MCVILNFWKQIFVSIEYAHSGEEPRNSILLPIFSTFLLSPLHLHLKVNELNNLDVFDCVQRVPTIDQTVLVQIFKMNLQLYFNHK